MRVIITAGGTGGHIYPALAMINKIKEMEPESEFLYIGTHNRMEKDIVPKNNIPFEMIEIYGFNRKNLLKNFKVLKCLIKSKKKCKQLIKAFNPDIVMGFGGYVTAPVLSVAHKLGYKTVIHEQNSIPGMSNKMLMRKVDLICVSLKSSLNAFPKEKTVFTGNPCGEDAVKKQAMNKKELGLKERKKLVLIVMGSLGASTVNDYLVNIKDKFKDKDYEVLFVTGKKDYEEIIKKQFPDNVKVVPYVDNLTRIMKKTDIIVTRAGASTLSEIIALNVPSILIPSPYVPNNHQFKNAMDLVNNKAALLIEEKDLKDNVLLDKIDVLMTSPIEYKNLKDNLNKLKIDNSASIIYENIKKLLDRK
ncbi:MAG: undecaprenyldiphospho-muramoylpentapeptide beta-N-acetylglucosaminyltransferase [Bacilli bacterium]|nr:undecaprenyldiphospho-muramoylpentapeptide beta-N-acetylglucosaminyltransferase [Bacilli bacterium]